MYLEHVAWLTFLQDPEHSNKTVNLMASDLTNGTQSQIISQGCK